MWAEVDALRSRLAEVEREAAREAELLIATSQSQVAEVIALREQVAALRGALEGVDDMVHDAIHDAIYEKGECDRVKQHVAEIVANWRRAALATSPQEPTT
jgi:hypothetical protein